jgi:hypothetical protein
LWNSDVFERRMRKEVILKETQRRKLDPLL